MLVFKHLLFYQVINVRNYISSIKLNLKAFLALLLKLKRYQTYIKIAMLDMGTNVRYRMSGTTSAISAERVDGWTIKTG